VLKLIALPLMLFAFPSFAQDLAAPASAGAQSPFMGVAPILLMFGVLYFLLIRPQQKKIAEHKKMLSELRRGDRVVTSGALIGTINKFEGDDIVVLDVDQNVKVRVAKSGIASVLTRTEPAGSSSEVANQN
jgi:preprotein translocase subunit YajC